MRNWFFVVMSLCLSCTPSEDDRRQQVQSRELAERLEWLHTETDPDLRRGALRSVVFYCQEKSIETACRELQYQLVWGGQQAVDMVSEDVTIRGRGWSGKVPAVAWRVASQTASTDDGKTKFHRIWLGYGGKP